MRSKTALPGHATPLRPLEQAPGVNVNPPTTNDHKPLAHLHDLQLADVEKVMLELLDAVRADQVPAEAQRQMHAFYDRFQRWPRHFLHHFAPFVCETDRWFDVPRSQPRLLDLGCGVATQAHLLALRGATIVGLDNNAERVAAGRAMTDWFATRAGSRKPHVSLHAEDAFLWLEQQPAASFDGCYTQFALAYMRPHRRMLELIDHVVRPGGRILFREFNAGSLYNRVVARVDWLTADDYQQVADQRGWTCRAGRFHWVLPRRIIDYPATHQWLRAWETRFTQWPAMGRNVAAAMTLMYEKLPRS